MHFTLCISHYAFHTRHFTLCISHYAFHTMHFTFGKALKKPIESVIMIIPCQTPPLSSLKTVIALRFFFPQHFLINWVFLVCLETHVGYVWNKLWLGKAWKKTRWNKVKEARSIVTYIENSMKLELLNTKFVLGLNRAKQLCLEHWKKNLRECDHHLRTPPPPLWAIYELDPML